MNGHTSASANKNRVYRKIKLAPTTSAIRSALAISAAMLALSGSGAVLAGTCVTDAATNTVTCNGVFTDDVSNSIPATVEDLTLIVGTDGTTTVDPADGVNGITSTWNGDATVINYAGITVSNADGIYMYTNNGAGDVQNDGDIYAYAGTADATGIYVGAYGDANASNSGSVIVGAAGASITNTTGIEVYSYGGSATADNSGLVVSSAYGGTAVGISANGYVSASVSNSGDLGVSSVTGGAYGIDVFAYGNSYADNSGLVEVTSQDADAFGLMSYSLDGDAYASNSGTVTVDAGDEGYGLVVAAGTGDANVDNSGSIDVHAETDAYGVKVFGSVDANVSNTGSVYAYGYESAYGIYVDANQGYASVTTGVDSSVAAYSGYFSNGIYAFGDLGASIDNAGSVYAFAGGQVVADDVEAAAAFDLSLSGDADIVNSGYLGSVVYAVSTDGSLTSYGALAVSLDGGASITNSGTIYAYAGVYGYQGITSFGALAAAIEGDVAVDNSGTITSTVYGYAYYNGIHAVGVAAYSIDGSVTVDNSGTIDATATNDPNFSAFYGGSATGIYAYSTYGDATVVNSGTVNATVNTSYLNTVGGTAVGIEAYTYGYGAYTTASVTNSGDVNVSVTGGEIAGYLGHATGVYAHSKYGDVVVDNSGSIGVTIDYGVASGIHTDSKYGDTVVSNSGTIDVTTTALGYYTYGIQSTSKYGDIAVDNSGTITVDGYQNGTFGPSAFGVFVSGTYSESLSVTNSGTIDVTATAASLLAVNYSYSTNAFGIYVSGAYAAVSVGNSGDISATAHSVSPYYAAAATGVSVYAGYDVSIGNSGSITATASADEYQQFGYAHATGVYAVSIYGDVTVANSGDISADASAFYGGATATGVSAIGVFGYYGEGGAYGVVTVDNSGSISATATSGDYSAYSIAQATGVSARSYVNGYVQVLNDGDISATASTGDNTYFSSAIATGVVVDTSYGPYLGSYVYNGGSITATASAGGGAYGYDNQADAYGVVAYNYLGTIDIVNAGSIEATASSGGAAGYANAVGISTLVTPGGIGGIDIYNSGDIAANAEDSAIGIRAQTYGSGPYYGSAYVGNSGSIEANAVGGYISHAIGVQLDGYSTTFYGAGGSISADAEGEYGATAYGVQMVGAYVDFNSATDISAYAYGGAYAFAAGAAVYGGAPIVARNYGDISAEAAGGASYAVGFVGASAGGGVTLYNYGGISATAGDLATGVFLVSNSYTAIYNYGDIEASGAAVNYAIYTAYYDSADYIYNAGTITGAINTGGGDDYLYNSYYGGVWNATGYSSFGDGDDTILNWGTINMTDAIIDLGYHAVTGNYFLNYGTIHVDGDNAIYMGHGAGGGGGGTLVPTAVPSLNPNAFYNGGVIDFQDGAADDTLLIVGDFAGYGEVNFDVDMATPASDRLIIDGSVAYDSQNTVNAYVTDLSQDIEGVSDPLIYVTGDSVADNFVLGDVNFDVDNSFVTLGFELIADIDETNATPDTWSLGMAVTGLTDVGTLAATLSPSVASLMNSQVGTWRQRMGVIDSFNKGAIALWARIFSDKGSFDPDHSAANFGLGGNFNWDQKNTGAEAGIDFSVTDEFSLGLLVAKSQSDTHLEDPGVGHNEIDADTWGVYGTWISPNGFYLDASYRWMDFDVDLNSTAGAMEADGKAEAFNIEVGYAWTLSGGLEIEPQFQWTKTKVDDVSVLTTINGMTFESDGGESSRGRLGVAIRKGFGDADAGWLWTPYATLSAVREFDGEHRFAVNNIFLGEVDVGGTSTLLELGFTARHQNWAIYGGLNWADGGALNSWFGGQLGVRYTFGHAAPPPPPPAPPPPKSCADLDDDGDGINNCDDKCLGSTAGQAVGPDGCPVPPPEPVVEPKPYRN
jgi:outer membrane autotransporter protein